MTSPDAADLVIGADLGGTFLKLGAVEPDGAIAARARVPTDRSGDPDRFVDWLGDAVAEFRGQLAPRAVVAAGLGSPGLIDFEDGVALQITNIPGLDGMPLGRRLEDRLGLPVILENDVNAMAFGEFEFGAGREFRNIVCLTLGTGVGGGLVFNGELYRGSGFTAGEIGHVCVDPHGLPCPCGSNGCLERYIGNGGIVAAARRIIDGGIPTSIPRYCDDTRGGRITPLAVSRAAEQGDSEAITILADAGRMLGIVLGGLMNLLAPDAFLVGGGLAGAGDLILEPARKEARLRVFRGLRDRVRILPASLGNDAGIVGCAALARSKPRAT